MLMVNLFVFVVRKVIYYKLVIVFSYTYNATAVVNTYVLFVLLTVEVHTLIIGIITRRK